MAETQSMTQDELVSALRERFGNDPMAWAFQCPACGDVATGQDFRDALAANPRTNPDGSQATASDYLGTVCIGRVTGAPAVPGDEWTGRGCDWCSFGLLRGPVRVDLADGHELWAFPIATAPEAAARG